MALANSVIIRALTKVEPAILLTNFSNNPTALRNRSRQSQNWLAIQNHLAEPRYNHPLQKGEKMANKPKNPDTEI